MQVAQWAAPETDDYIIDVCAAPGGKAIHLAEMLAETGHVEARDLTEYKVGLIRETAVEGRKRTYVLTDEGRARYEEELVRLRSCLADAEEERRAMDYETEDGAQTVPG